MSSICMFCQEHQLPSDHYSKTLIMVFWVYFKIPILDVNTCYINESNFYQLRLTPKHIQSFSV